MLVSVLHGSESPVPGTITELSKPVAAVKITYYFHPYAYQVRKRHKSQSPILVCEGITEISAKNTSSGCSVICSVRIYRFYYQQMRYFDVCTNQVIFHRS